MKNSIKRENKLTKRIRIFRTYQQSMFITATINKSLKLNNSISPKRRIPP